MCDSESPVECKLWLLSGDTCDSRIGVNSSALVLSSGCVTSSWSNILDLGESMVLDDNVGLGVEDPSGNLEVGGVWGTTHRCPSGC